MKPHRESTELPFDGFRTGRQETKFVDLLTDDDLRQLNRIMDWKCFTVDRYGRRFGGAAWKGKRDEPETIPDNRVVLLNEWFGLSDKHVLEIGCFEGIHTIALNSYAGKVTAIDVRVENIVKTIVRCAFFGHQPTVFKCNIEERPLDFRLLNADVVYHVGVLYHLRDPVEHLFDLGNLTRDGLLLDTHYSPDEDATEQYEVRGRMIRYKLYREGGQSDAFSGAYDHSKWLRLEDMTELLTAAGFGRIDIIEKRVERNGPRVLLLARRDAAG